MADPIQNQNPADYDTQVSVAVQNDPFGFINALNRTADEKDHNTALLLRESACVIANLILTDDDWHPAKYTFKQPRLLPDATRDDDMRKSFAKVVDLTGQTFVDLTSAVAMIGLKPDDEILGLMADATAKGLASLLAFTELLKASSPRAAQILNDTSIRKLQNIYASDMTRKEP